MAYPAIDEAVDEAIDEKCADPWQTLTASATPPHDVGMRFQILRPHAKGGLGEVFIARDLELNREVALKEIRAQHADDPNSRSRFLLEAEVTGGLEHPGIVPVYALGSYADGRPYYAMRFIRGETLKGAIDRFHKASGPLASTKRSLELRQLLGRFCAVCEAIEYAHSRGVLHRDLKPGNIMLGDYGETLVVDWGLAKPQNAVCTADRHEPLAPQSGSGSVATQLGVAVGTPAYMSPEQATGRLDQIGPASDVYCLGATLYEVLTGQPPIMAPHVGEVLRRVSRGEFPAPREIQPGLSRPLEAICLKAMALKPGDRYASATALAYDINRWLADEETVALPDTRLATAGRWLQRHKTFTRAAAAIVITIAFAASLSAALIHQQKRQVERLTSEIFLLAHQLHDVEYEREHLLLANQAKEKVAELHAWTTSSDLESSSSRAIVPKRK